MNEHQKVSGYVGYFGSPSLICNCAASNRPAEEGIEVPVGATNWLHLQQLSRLCQTLHPAVEKKLVAADKSRPSASGLSSLIPARAEA